MNLNAIMSADMATIGRTCMSGLRWWRDELVAMVPARFRIGRSTDRPMAIYVGSDRLRFFRSGRPFVSGERPAGTMTYLDVAVSDDLALIREIELPSMSRNELRQMVRLEAERLMPLAGNDMLTDGVILKQAAGAGRMHARIAGLRRPVAEAALMASESAAIVPIRLGIVTADAPQAIEFDFAPLLREEGRLAGVRRAATLWWALVAIGFVFNIALLVIRDRQKLERVTVLVEAQAPAVRIVRTITARITSMDRNARLLVARRAGNDTLGDLGAATAAMPDRAWVQRYAWDGRSIRLGGYKPAAIDILAELRRSPRFANVRPTSSDVLAEIPAGQPFDVTADIVGRGR